MTTIKIINCHYKFSYSRLKNVSIPLGRKCNVGWKLHHLLNNQRNTLGLSPDGFGRFALGLSSEHCCG